MRRIYRPLYSASQAQLQHRPWTQPTQLRTDGAASYYKFVAWTFTAYDRLLHVDCDAFFPECSLDCDDPYTAMPSQGWGLSR